MENLEELNLTKSKSKAENKLNEFIAEYKIPNIVNKESFSSDVVENMKKEFLKFTEKFISLNIGLGGTEKCLEILPGFICETFGSIYSRVIDVFKSEMSDVDNNF